MISEEFTFDVKNIVRPSLKLDEQGELYKKSICQLLCLIEQKHTASAIAASVLLCAYNSFEYKVAVADLILLEIDGLKAATNIIYLRSVTGLEPHLLIENGEVIFYGLQIMFGEYAKYHHDAVGTAKHRAYLSGDEDAMCELRVE